MLYLLSGLVVIRITKSPQKNQWRADRVFSHSIHPVGGIGSKILWEQKSSCEIGSP